MSVDVTALKRLAIWTCLLAGLGIATAHVSGCIPTDLHKRVDHSGSAEAAGASQGEAVQEVEIIYCFGFCAQMEAGSEAETATIQKVLQKVEQVAETEQEQAEQIDKIDRRVKKVRKLDEALYGEDPELKEIVE